MLFYKNKCTGCLKCAKVCPNELKKCDLCGKCEIYCPNDARKVCGKQYDVDEILKEVLKDKAFYDNSDGGVTFSGGECMLQIDFLCEILKRCKQCGVHTAVDTAGNVRWERFEKVLPYTDLFLYDIKAFDDETHKKYVGVSNRLILENLKKLFENNANVWIRIPVIPTVNDDAEEMRKIKAFLQPFNPLKVELLPYHRMGEHKYDALGLEMTKFEVPDKEKIDELKKIFV